MWFELMTNASNKHTKIRRKNGAYRADKHRQDDPSNLLPEKIIQTKAKFAKTLALVQVCYKAYHIISDHVLRRPKNSSSFALNLAMTAFIASRFCDHLLSSLGRL